MRNVAFLVLTRATPYFACFFADRGMPLPRGHPQALGTRKLSSIGDPDPNVCSLPGCYIEDPTGTAVHNHCFETPGLHPCAESFHGLLRTTGMIEALDSLATTTHGEDLCYWAFQSLPPPRQSENNFTDEDAKSVLLYGTNASYRYHSLMGNGVFEGGISTAGSLVNKRLCERGYLQGQRCDIRILKSNIVAPTAIQVFRVTSGNSKAIKREISAWRSQWSLHAPNIAWVYDPGPNGGHGWGLSGALISKVVKCAEIPDKFREGTKTLGPDPIFSASNSIKPLADEAMEKWQSMLSLFNISMIT